MSAKKWLDANNRSRSKKLRASAEETLNTLVETNANERRRHRRTTRARASAEEDVANVACGTEWMRESARRARVRELTELNQRADEELAAIVDRRSRRATEESATATASTSVGTSNEEHEREVKKLRDAKAWADGGVSSV